MVCIVRTALVSDVGVVLCSWWSGGDGPRSLAAVHRDLALWTTTS